MDRTFRGGTTGATDFELSVLMNRHPEYLSRKEQFLKKWEKPTSGGVSILRIFKVKVCARRRRELVAVAGGLDLSGCNPGYLGVFVGLWWLRL